MLPPSNNGELEESLEELPDLIHEAKIRWGVLKLDREKIEAMISNGIRGENPDITATHMKEKLHLNADRYEACLAELKAEAQYEFLYEKLMTKKKLCDLRTAF